MVGTDSRVAIYIDFDNIVISRAKQVKERGEDPTVAIDLLLGFATKHGRLTISRAYADWSVATNADYRDQLVSRAVELVQLFPASQNKNGADIRLAVDAIEDLYLHPDLTHVVIAAGDSDFVPLAQRARRLGRVVLGVGVAGSISRALASACDEYVEYEELLRDRRDLDVVAELEEPRRAVDSTASSPSDVPPRRAYSLLKEALRGVQAQHPEREWHPLSALKTQVLRIEPTFSERVYGAGSFSELLGRFSSQIEVKDNRARSR